MKFTDEFSEKTDKLKSLIENTDAIVIGAGAGLPAAAGLTYSGERFHRNFCDFEAKYNFHDMYSGGFYPYETAEEYWAYWSRYILLNRYCAPPKPVYEQLLSALRGKDYFVITTNVDHCFQRAGFDKERLFYTQGDYGLFQCSEPCRNKTYDNEEAVRQMVKREKDMKVPKELLPRCPVCGKPMVPNLRTDEKFVEDAGWHAACGRYEEFLKNNAGKKTLFLELGVGMNTPVIIKYPFWRLTAQNKKAFYVCVNMDMAYAPDEIKDRSLCFSEDIALTINALKQNFKL